MAESKILANPITQAAPGEAVLPPVEAAPFPEPTAAEVRLNTALFMQWYSEQSHTPGVPAFTSVIEWAERQGMKLSPETFALLAEVHRVVAKLIEKERYQLFASSGETFSWSKFLWSLSEHERQQKPPEDSEQDKPTADKRAQDEREDRERTNVRSALTFRPLSPDSQVIKDLEWRLTAGGLPAEEVQNVIAYLNQIDAKRSNN